MTLIKIVPDSYQPLLYFYILTELKRSFLLECDAFWVLITMVIRFFLLKTNVRRFQAYFNTTLHHPWQQSKMLYYKISIVCQNASSLQILLTCFDLLSLQLELRLFLQSFNSSWKNRIKLTTLNKLAFSAFLVDDILKCNRHEELT